MKSYLQGNIAVWLDGRNGNQDIYAADISDPENVIEFAACTDPFEQGIPTVYGDIIAWQDYRSGDIDVYGYDIATGTEFPIATGPGNQFRPAIYENLVIWSNEIGDQTNIHGNYIIPEPATLALLALGGLAMIRRRRQR